MAYIIVIEDDELVLAVVKRTLLNQDHEVLCLEDGLDIITEITKRKPDLVISDINLPFKNGLQIMEEIKKVHGDEIPIIGMSSTPLSDLKNKELYQQNMNAFLAKPFNKNDLKEKISLLLQ